MDMKFALTLILLVTSSLAFAESPCDIRIGHSVGVQVVEFATGNVVHSKMALKEMSQSSLTEEMISLQDMGVCEEKIVAKRCILKLEKKVNTNQLTLFRGQDRWISWQANAKLKAQEFVKSLQKAGFCS
jgi:hypothetical protein